MLLLHRTKPRKDLMRVDYGWSTGVSMEEIRQITGATGRVEDIHGLFAGDLFPLGIHI